MTVGLVAALGYYHVEGVGVWAALATALGLAAGCGYIEEVICRGVVVRAAEEALGTWLALGITVALFGLGHLGNPNATLYLRGRGHRHRGGHAARSRLRRDAAALTGGGGPLRLELHAGGRLRPESLRSGGQPSRVPAQRPRLLSGGALGVEGSVVAIAVCLAASLVVLKRAQREGGFIRPFWRRRSAGSS